MEQKQPSNFVGANIRKLRYRKGLTQEALAAKCTVAGYEITRGTLSKIEAQIQSVNDAQLFIIARVLSVKIEELFPSNFVALLKSR